MKKLNYVTPEMEVVAIATEQFFANSLTGTEDYGNDVDTSDWDF